MSVRQPYPVATSSGSGSGVSLVDAIAQTAHGFSVGNVLYYTGTAYAKAKADATATAEVVGIVSVVTDANNFTLLTNGYITTLSALTAGTVYFLSDSSAGALTATEPTTVGSISKPLLTASSTTAGYFDNMRGAVVVAASSSVFNIEFIIDGGGSAITTGIKGDLEISFPCTITQATLLADQSGSIVIDIWKQVYASYPPTVTQTITASAKPTLSSAVKYQDSTLTGWTTSISAGDTLRFNVDSITTCTRVLVSLRVTK